jgi:hypothetical protein
MLPVRFAAVAAFFAVAVYLTGAQEIVTPTVRVTVTTFSATPDFINANFPRQVARALEVAETRVVLGGVEQQPDNVTVLVNFFFPPPVDFEKSAPELAGDFRYQVQNPAARTAAFLTNLSDYMFGDVVVSGTFIEPTAQPPNTTLAPTSPPTAAPTTTEEPTTAEASNWTAAPTQQDPLQADVEYPQAASEEDGNGLIYAIVFGLIGGIAIIGGVTFCIKKYATKDRTNYKGTSTGKKYQARNM